ncbi:hypothetical protein Tco_1549511 [Tanacetum coccineum]
MVSLSGFLWNVGFGVEARQRVRQVKRRMRKRSREDCLILVAMGQTRRRMEMEVISEAVEKSIKLVAKQNVKFEKM